MRGVRYTVRFQRYRAGVLRQQGLRQRARTLSRVPRRQKTAEVSQVWRRLPAEGDAFGCLRFVWQRLPGAFRAQERAAGVLLGLLLDCQALGRCKRFSRQMSQGLP